MAEFLKKADIEIIFTVIAQSLDGEKLDQKTSFVTLLHSDSLAWSDSLYI